MSVANNGLYQEYVADSSSANIDLEARYETGTGRAKRPASEIYVTGGGNLTVTFAGGGTSTLTVPDGWIGSADYSAIVAATSTATGLIITWG